MSESPGKRLTLIGVVHRDPRGEQRVLALLEKLQCDAVGLEVSEFALQWRARNGPLLAGKVADLATRFARTQGLDANGILEHGEIQGILHMLTIPFEVQAAAEYSAQTGTPYFLLDDSDISRELLSVIPSEMITEDNIAALIQKPDFDYAQSIERLYEECSRILSSEPVPRHRLGLSEEQLRFNEKRDEHIEKKLLSLMSDLPGNWVHICGFTHILRSDGFRNMAARFPDAKRILALNRPGKKG